MGGISASASSSMPSFHMPSPTAWCGQPQAGATRVKTRSSVYFLVWFDGALLGAGVKGSQKPTFGWGGPLLVQPHF